MSRYDGLRKQLGINVSDDNASSDEPQSGTSKYDSLRRSLGIVSESQQPEPVQSPDAMDTRFRQENNDEQALQQQQLQDTEAAFRKEMTVPPEPSFLDKSISAVNSFRQGTNTVLDAAANSATFGAYNKLLENNNETERIDNQHSGLGVAGEVLGMIPGGELAYRGATKLIGAGLKRISPKITTALDELGAANGVFGSKAAEIGARGVTAGALYGTAREATDAALGNKQDFTGRLQDIGMDAALFGAGDGVIGALSPSVSKAFGALRNAGNDIAKAEVKPTLGTVVNDFTKRVNGEQIPISKSEGPSYGGVNLSNRTVGETPRTSTDMPTSNIRPADEIHQEANAYRSQLEEKYGKTWEMDAPPAEVKAFDDLSAQYRQARTENPVVEPSTDIRGNADTSDYAGNTLPFRQAPIQAERTINRNEVVQNMRKNLDAVIDTGRLSGGRGVLGQYKGTPEVIRTKMTEDLQVISHEVGHHLDKKFKLNDPGFQPELDTMVNTANPGHLANYPANKHLDEGIAEYVRLRLTDTLQAKQLAPNFTKFFEQQLDKKALKGLEASSRDVDTWITQGEYNQAKGLIDFKGGNGKAPMNKDKVYAKFVDDLNYLKLAEKSLKGKVGMGDESVYKMARLSRGMEEKAKLAVTRGIYDAQGNKLSEGLTEIVKPLEKMGVKESDFTTYLAVLHAKDLKTIHGKQVPFTDGQMNAVLNRLDTQELRDVQKNIIKFNDSLMDILVDAQIIEPLAVSAMRKKYPNYVPFMRYFDDDAIAGFKNGGFGSAKGFANIANPIKKMSEEGSLRTIINPVESMIKNTFLVMNAAAKNKVGLQLAELSKIDGAGAWVENVGKGGASPTEHVISVFENGQKQSYKIREPELYNAMLSLDAESSNSLIKFLGGMASVLRAGATLTPEFMVRNAFRDVAGASINSTKYGFNPLDFFKGLFHVVGKTKTFDQFLSSGGAMGTIASLDRDLTREALTGVFRKSFKEKALNVVTSPKELAKMVTGITPIQKTVGLLRKGAEISELSTKVGLFNKTLNKTGSLEEAAYTARDIMDFNRAGSAIRPANKAVAFLNASIQGTDRMARSFKDNPAGFMVRAFTTLVLPSIALNYYNNNLPDDMKKEYENIPQWQKDSFFILGIPGVGFARIPKPFEAGMLFSTGTDRVMKYLENNDPKAFKGYGQTLMQSFTPPMMISAFTPLLEALTNHSLFRNAPIVPMGEQRLEKKDQYGLFTSELSKGIGNLVSKTPFKDTNAASPRIIDNTIKGYTAGLGQYAVDAIDRIMNGVTGTQKNLPDKGATEQPFLRSFFASTAGGGQIRQDFYDKWDELSKKKASADKNNERFTDTNYYRVKAGKDAIDKIMKAYKVIQADDKLSPSEKRTKLDQFDKVMNDLARKSLGK